MMSMAKGGTRMFTLADIRDLAIQIERNGESTYSLAARKAGDERVARLLKKLAEQEKEHSRWFERLDAGHAFRPQDDRINRMGQDMLKEMVDGQTFSLDEDELSRPGEMRDVIALSIEFEKDTIIFYEMLSSFLDDSETIQQLERIIDEERSHIAALNDIAKLIDSEKGGS
jgi:rubrerythrin